jgi:uncharacterized membrane protein
MISGRVILAFMSFANFVLFYLTLGGGSKLLISLATILKASLEVALIIVLFVISLNKNNFRNLRSALGLGLLGALVSALAIVYRVDFFGDREIFEGVLSSIASIFAVGFWFWNWWSLRKSEERTAVSKGLLIFNSGFIFLAVWVLSLGKTIEVVLYPSTVFVMDANLLSTELILKFIGNILGILITVFFSVSILKTEARITKKMLIVFSGAVLLVMIFRQLIMVLQILFALGLLPMTPWAVDIIAPLINSYYPMFFYLMIGLTVILWGTVGYKLKKEPPNVEMGKNPAARRKIKALFNREKRWVKAIGASLVLVIALLVSNEALANREVKLEPPKPVTAENGEIKIPVEEVNDGKLYRFSYTTEKGIETRFLVIKKSETLYGTGLDACDICGNAGYFQDGKDVFCKNCMVIINTATIGFPGGCNPIPVKHKPDGKYLIFKISDLESRQDIFKK